MSRDVVVIGAGAIGLCSAFSLARGGDRVTVIDRANVGAGASGSTAALLEYQVDSDRNPDLFRFAALSRALFPELESDVRALTGLDFALETEGILALGLTPDDVDWLKVKVDRYRRAGLRAEWLDASAARQRVPQIVTDIFGAAWFGEDGQVGVEQFMAAMEAACRAVGVAFELNAGEVRLSREGGRISVLGGGRTRLPDAVVVAAGAWSARVLAGLGVDLPVSPVKGQLAVLEAPVPDLPIPVWMREGGYVAPKRTHLLVGSTVEQAGFNAEPDDAGRLTLASRARRMLDVPPPLMKVISGLRPATPDLLPVIGFLPGSSDVLVATGHYRNGILLAPATGRLVADLLHGLEPCLDLSPFRFDRFVPASPRR